MHLQTVILSMSLSFTAVHAALAQWNQLEVLCPGDPDVDHQILGMNNTYVSIHGVSPFNWVGGESNGCGLVQAVQGTHPPQPYFYVTQKNQIVLDVQGGTPQFYFDNNDEQFSFRGSKDFKLCKDDGSLYTNLGPYDCANIANVTIHSVPLDTSK